MTAWLDLVLFNVVSSAGLAMAAWWVSRRLRRPALAHTLWLLVLIKLVTPPLVEIERLPRFASTLTGSLAFVAPSRTPDVPVEPAATGIASTATVSRSLAMAPQGNATREEPSAGEGAPESASSAGMLSEHRAGPMLARLLFLVPLAGTVWLAGLTLLRLWRFRRRLQCEPEAPEEVRQRAVELARILGVDRLPRIRLVSQSIAPSVWPGFRGCEILLPAHLLPRLSADERDMLIAHELAHVRRRDHWVRPLEQLVVALYWWNPIAWWARRHLRVEEEKSCDALVLEKLPRQARVYAEGLLKSIEFLVTNPRFTPALATGAGTAMRLEERMKAILDAKKGRRDSRWLRSLFILPAALTLLLAPAWVGDSAGVGEPAEKKQEKETLNLHREELRLQKELREIESQHVKVQLQIEEIVQERERRRVLEEIQRLEAEGLKEEAESLRREIARTEREAAFNREQQKLELEYSQRREALEFQLQELALQREELLLRGDAEQADALLERLQEVEVQLRQLQLDIMRNDLERSRKLLGLSQQELENLEKP